MQIIQNITSDPAQQQTVVLPDGSKFSLRLRFEPQQLGWFITSLSYGDKTINALRITCNTNILRQWKNVLPFGIGCLTNSNREPTQIEDFFSGEAELFLLSQDEVLQYEAYLGAE